MGQWRGLAAPKGTPPAVIKTLHDAFKKGMEDPAFVKNAADMSVALAYVGPGRVREADGRRRRALRQARRGDQEVARGQLTNHDMTDDLRVVAPALGIAGCATTEQAAPPAAAAPSKTTIRIGSPFKPGHILVDTSEKFKELVETRSGGRIAVVIDAGTKTEIDINKLNSAGELEMQSNGTNFLELYAPPYYFFTGPYVMKDFDHYMRVWNGKLGQQAMAEMEKNGNLKYLGTIYRGLRQTTTKKPVYTPADLYGVKLRLPPIPTWMAVWKAEDASPVPLPLTELYSGLKSGKADASEGDLPQIVVLQARRGAVASHHDQPPGADRRDADQQALLRRPVARRSGPGRQGGEGSHATGPTTKMKTGELGYLIELQRKGMQVVIPRCRLVPDEGEAGVRRAVQDPVVGHDLGGRAGAVAGRRRWNTGSSAGPG